jgi:hypothetical protein
MTEVNREALDGMTVEQVAEHIADKDDLEFLEKLAAAERDGKDRAGVHKAIEARVAEIEDEEVDDDEDGERTPATEVEAGEQGGVKLTANDDDNTAVPATEPPPSALPAEGDDAPPPEGEQEDGGDDTYPTAPVEQDLPVDAEREEVPVDEVLVVINEGDWARIKGNATSVPAHARGRDVAILTAPKHRTTGPSDLSDTFVEYQLPADPFVVKLRDSGEIFECTRAAFAAFGPYAGNLTEQVEQQKNEAVQRTAQAKSKKKQKAEVA